MSASGADPVDVAAGVTAGAGLRLVGRCLHPGTAWGSVMAVSEPLSFWGGVDPSGTVVDVHHPRHGQSVTGRVLAMPSGRGSSSSTAVLAELVRSGQGPAALVLSECDTILVVGALVAAEMYAVSLPIVELSADDLVALRDGVAVHVRGHAASGEAVVQEGGP